MSPKSRPAQQHGYFDPPCTAKQLLITLGSLQNPALHSQTAHVDSEWSPKPFFCCVGRGFGDPLGSTLVVWLYGAGFWRLLRVKNSGVVVQGGVLEACQGKLSCVAVRGGVLETVPVEISCFVVRGFGDDVRPKLAVLLCKAGCWRLCRVQICCFAVRRRVLESFTSKSIVLFYRGGGGDDVG